MQLLLGRGADKEVLLSVRVRACAPAARAALTGAAAAAARRQNGTPLHWAVQSGHLECARLLLQAGACREAAITVRCTRLHTRRRCCPDTRRCAGAPQDGETPLHFAAHKGRPDIVLLLIEHGASTDATTNVRDAAARRNARQRALTCVCCVQKGKTPLDVAKDDATRNALRSVHTATARLLEAVQCGDDAAAAAALARGARTSSRDADGWSPMHLAALNSHAGCVQLLIDRGAPVDVKVNVRGAHCSCAAAEAFSC